VTFRPQRIPRQDNAATLIGSAEAAEALCARLSKTMDDLIASIEAETQLLRAGKLRAAGELQSNKSELAKAYVAGIAEFKNNAVALGRLAPTSIEVLRERHEEFRSMLQINLAVLATAREVAQDLVRTVAEKTSAGPATTTYGRTGAMNSQRVVGERGLAVDGNF